MNYLTNINLNRNELQNAVIQPLAIAPVNPKLGQIYFNSVDKFVYKYDGTQWSPVGVVYNQGTKTGAVVTGLGKTGNVTTTKVIELTLDGMTAVSGGYVTEGMTLQAAIKALDEAVKNAVAGGGEINQNAFSNVVTGQQSTGAEAVAGNAESVTISAKAKTDSMTLSSGNRWVQIKGNADTKTVTLGHELSGVSAKSYGSATSVAKVTVDAAGHITAASEVPIVGANYITNLTSDAQSQLNSKIPTSEKGKPNGVATLGNDGLIPTTQLPSYVDDVVEAYVRASGTTLSTDWLSLTDGGAALTPEKGKIYVVISEGNYKNKQYRWTGNTYVLCNPSDVNSVNGKTGVVVLTQDDIASGNNNKVFTKAEQDKLNAIEAQATKNSITLNGSKNANPSFFAPTTGGSAGQVLTSNGTAAPSWKPAPESVHKYTGTNAQITASGGAFVWKIASATHGIQNQAILVQLYESASGSMVVADVAVNPSTFEVTITINDVDSKNTLTANTYRVVMIG